MPLQSQALKLAKSTSRLVKSRPCAFSLRASGSLFDTASGDRTARSTLLRYKIKRGYVIWSARCAR
jgi:hypothetical protein